jgi:hypothetical protein
MSGISRRQLLTASGLVAATALGAAGIGSAIGSLIGLPPRTRRSSPPIALGPTSRAAPAKELISALARERQLLAGLGAAASGQPSGAVLDAIASDHRAHIAALAAAIGAEPETPAVTPSIAAIPSAQLRAAEQAAHDSAAAESALLTGAEAVLLASIAACEAGHVELLS